MLDMLRKPLLELTAADLMSRMLVLVPSEMSLPGAARLLSQAHVSGAPVVDAAGRCVGVLSATDFVRWAQNHRGEGHSAGGNSCFCQPWQIGTLPFLWMT